MFELSFLVLCEISVLRADPHACILSSSLIQITKDRPFRLTFLKGLWHAHLKLK